MIVIQSVLTNLANIAKIVDISPQQLSNYKSEKRNDTYKFPAEVYDNMYNTNEIISFLENVGAVQKGEYCYIPIIADDNRLNISIVGEARTGKDYHASLYTYSPKKFIKLFCAGGHDKTRAIEKLYIVPETNNFIKFHIPKERINEIDNNGLMTKDEIARLYELEKRYYNIDVDEDEFNQLVDNVKLFEKFCEATMKNNIQEDIYIEIRMRPSVFAKKIMDDLGKKSMLIYIYPGQTGNVTIGSFVKSDLFVFTIGDQNEEVAMKSITNIAKNIKPYCADAKVIVLYKGTSAVTSVSEYDDEQKAIVECFKDFKPMFNEIRNNDSVIESDLSILRMEEHVLVSPVMNRFDPTTAKFAFEEFNKRFINEIVTLLKDDECMDKLKEICKDSNQRQFVLDVIRNIPIQLEKGNVKHYLKGGDRVYSYDSYQCMKKVQVKMYNLREIVYKYFLNFSKEDYKEGWQQTAIQCLYKIMSKSVRDDEGIGIGTQSREMQPPVTMRAEESLIAETLLELYKHNNLNEQTYKEALRSIGIDSASWSNVYIVWDENLKERMIKRITIICDILSEYDGDLLEKALGSRQVVSSLLLSVFEVYTLACNMTNDEAMGNLKSIIKSF